MYELIREGKALIRVPKVSKISKEMEVFYNPIMKFNRDISILLLNSIDKNNLQICDLLAGSGVRSIRFLLELKKKKIKSIIINDYSKEAINSIKKNFQLNKINKNKIKVYNEDANLLLLKSEGFDYIDIDPFGTPNPYLDSAIRRISRGGILAVTSTDTSALAGTYPKACLRKYWAIPLRNELMHEIGLRILIRKVQLIGAQYNKALIPVFSYFKDHYVRVFFKCEKSKEETDNILKQHGMFENSGPIWKGQLWDNKLIEKMNKSNNENPLYPMVRAKLKPIKNESNNKILTNFLKIIKEESKINVVGFYDIHSITEKYKIRTIPKKLELIKKIKKAGYKASETHFNGAGIRSDIGLKELLRLILKKLINRKL